MKILDYIIDKYYNIEGYWNYHIWWNIKEFSSKIWKMMKRFYQIITPWYGHRRWLLHQCDCNWGKLLDGGLSWSYQRTRGNKTVYYKLTTSFGRVKFYKHEYIDTKTKENVNTFLSVFIPALCGDENADEGIVEQKTLLYKGWAWTRKQTIQSLKTIKELAKDLSWEFDIVGGEMNAYEVARQCYDCLCGERVWWLCCDNITETKKDKLLCSYIHRIRKELNYDKESWGICGELIYKTEDLSLEDQTKERDEELKKNLEMILKKLENIECKHCWEKYYD